MKTTLLAFLASAAVTGTILTGCNASPAEATTGTSSIKSSSAMTSHSGIRLASRGGSRSLDDNGRRGDRDDRGSKRRGEDFSTGIKRRGDGSIDDNGFSRGWRGTDDFISGVKRRGDGSIDDNGRHSGGDDRGRRGGGRRGRG